MRDGSLSQKYRAWRAREAEKLRPMTRRERIQYVTTYYWLEMMGAVILIAVLAFFGTIIYHRGDVAVLHLVVVDSDLSKEGETALCSEIMDVLGDTENRHGVVLDTSVTTRGEDADAEMESYYQTKALLLVAAGDVDVYLCPASYYEFLKAYEDCESLRSVMGAEFCARYEDRIVDDTAIRIAGGPLAEMGVVSYEPCYLTLSVCAKNQQNAVRFIQYAVGAES